MAVDWHSIDTVDCANQNPNRKANCDTEIGIGQKKCGEGGIRTSPSSSTNLVVLDQGGAESGALCLSDPRLGSLIDAWPALPEPIRAGILAIIRASGA
jgi:hypothetical protein